MVAFKRKPTCTDAEPYYYEFLSGAEPSGVPADIAEHIQTCGQCREEVERLGDMLAESEAAPDADRSKRDKVLTDALSRHFAYIDEEVDCTRARPFLPDLLQVSSAIRIPTPITVHIDHCPLCAEDMRSIAFLNLDTDQLERLGQVLGAAAPGNGVMCRRAQSRLVDLARGALEGIAPEILDHISICPRCRARVYAHRAEILTALRMEPPETELASSEHLDPAELFDCVLPYGRSPGLWSESVAHLEHCPECLERAQSLHRTLYGIAERGDSETVTVYTVKEDAEGVSADVKTGYEGHPIDVSVFQRDRSRASRADVRVGLKRRLVHPVVRPFAKAGVLIAAMIPLAIVLFVYTQSASGTDPEAIAAAFGRAANVHARTFHGDRTEPTEEIWGSRALDWLMLIRADRERVLYDLGARNRTGLRIDTGELHTVKMHPTEIEDARRYLERFLGLPLAEIPADRQWRQVAHDDVEGVEEYELIYQAEASDGSTYSVKWEVAVDSRKKLPLEARLLNQRSPEGEWTQISRSEFEYPAKEAIRAAVEACFPVEAGRSILPVRAN